MKTDLIKPTNIPRPTSARRRAPKAEVDTVVIGYFGYNNGKASSVEELESLRQLALQSEKDEIGFILQGYAKSESGAWETRRYVIRGGHYCEESLDQANLFDAEVLSHSVKTALDRFPNAHHQILCVSSHGGGYRCIAGESVHSQDMYKQDNLALDDFTDSLKGAVGGEKLNYILFTGCNMGQHEALTMMAPVTERVIASPAVTYAEGRNPITLVCEEFLSEPSSFDNAAVAAAAKGAWGQGRTLSPLVTYHTDACETLDRELEALGRFLERTLEQPETRPELMESLGKTQTYYGDLVDLRKLVLNLDEADLFHQSAQRAKTLEALDELTGRRTFRRGHTEGDRLGVFLPRRPKHVHTDKVRERLPEGCEELPNFETISRALVATLEHFSGEGNYPESVERLADYITQVMPRIMPERQKKIKKCESLLDELKGLSGAEDAKTNEARALAILDKVNKKVSLAELDERLWQFRQEDYCREWSERARGALEVYVETAPAPAPWKKFVTRYQQYLEAELLERAQAVRQEDRLCERDHELIKRWF